jgi:hypothetical protein
LLNLGEQFLARWNDRNGSGETILISEQVSHHPPVSAVYLENQKAGVSANGHSRYIVYFYFLLEIVFKEIFTFLSSRAEKFFQGNCSSN